MAQYHFFRTDIDTKNSEYQKFYTARSLKAEWRMTDRCSGEKGLCELDLNIHLYLTLNYVMLQNTWNIVHKKFMVFNNVFVAFVGLNNDTILAM